MKLRHLLSDLMKLILDVRSVVAGLFLRRRRRGRVLFGFLVD